MDEWLLKNVKHLKVEKRVTLDLHRLDFSQLYTYSVGHIYCQLKVRVSNC